MRNITERLRKHVENRGGAALQNGAWAMMLEAANWIEHLEAIDLARAKKHAVATMALEICAAPYATPAGTVEQCSRDIAAEFQRRMDAAQDALSSLPSPPTQQAKSEVEV